LGAPGVHELSVISTHAFTAALQRVCSRLHLMTFADDAFVNYQRI
jgi:hypothetical protein